ncbi:MarR family winged helix-turn-helix transcriptional regulator [Lactococcus insecticola]|uniref:MarR family transcriptional regulator n=1 Tax=Pseudolactococcus insecticola TaxID=2709158 RepID=A0A6A0B902_9LACT|nr:MarR family winged helix-turn-helix transcriptional regulator [Lactococcus insecticola]GFH41316.1 MarR family transcriptional regulator [Lactococcus insecticola]
MTEDKIGVELRELTISITRFVAKHRPQEAFDEVTGLQIWVTEYLIRHQDEDIFQKDIEKKFIMRRPTATTFIKKMEQTGLITREPVAYDARLKKIILTDKAFAMYDVVEARMTQFETVLRGDLDADEIAAFIATINKIKTNLGGENV